jgi:phenazine biosynthesis protein phzE
VAHDDGTPLAVVDIATEREIPLDELVDALPDEPVTFADEGGFETSDEDYGAVVERIIRDEIGNGEGANLVIGRHYRAQLNDWNADRALTVLRRLLTAERGAYWTYCFWTGDRFLIGASPERHVSVHGGDVRMNPISGTFRLRGLEPTERKQRLLEFLADEKEIYELFMVVDEELKMMCDICHEGGQVLGPFLKPMTHLVHTEYLLAGRTRSDVRDVLRDTMFAATVTGRTGGERVPADPRVRVRGPRLLRRRPRADRSRREGLRPPTRPIVIRTADVSPTVPMKVTAGATPGARLEARLRGGRDAGQGRRHPVGVRAGPGATGTPTAIADLTQDEDVLIALNSRKPAAREVLADRPGPVRPRPRRSPAGRSRSSTARTTS